MLTSLMLARFESRLKEAGLPVSVQLWNGTTVGASQEASVQMKLKTPAAVGLLLNPTMGKFARSYVEQQLDVDGAARDVLRFTEVLCRAETEARRGRRWRSWGRHTHLFDRQAISSHYDVSDEFFGLWLDRQRVYSCGYFRRADDTLDIAQEQKLDHICRKLQLAPGERFLDLGCGWGALAIWAASRYNVRALGVTLSQNQHAYAQERIRALGLEGLCEVRLLDYRDVPEDDGYDKIASVGMFEHVGRKNFPVYFGKIARLLRPGGLVMNHGITLNTPGQQYLGSGIGEFIHEYVFPGGELAHVSQVVEAMSAQGLEPWDVESLRPHYAKTLWSWVERLESARAAAIATVGEKAYRVWRVYMAGSAHAFERGWMSIHQVLAGKPLPNGALALPLTRDHIYAR
jgi:cyclopropane-fatty-acyl-phospholipid synthase